MKNKVLITSCGRKVSLVKAFREAGWYVIGQDSDREAVGLSFCDEFWKGPLPHLMNIECDLWIPTRDAEIKTAWNHNNWLTGGIDTCIDKFKFYQFCKRRGFSSPEVYFVKPRISSSGKETECVWQEMVSGEEYSVDLFADFNGQVISVVPRIRCRTVSGESVVTVTVKQEHILDLSVQLASKLGLIGHCVLQGFLCGSDFYFTDINARFGGASIVGIKAGCKSPEWLLKLVNGEKVAPCIGDYKVGLTGKSYTEWTFED